MNKSLTIIIALTLYTYQSHVFYQTLFSNSATIFVSSGGILTRNGGISFANLSQATINDDVLVSKNSKNLLA